MFTPEEKEIFSFHDGKKERRVDPLKFQRKFQEKIDVVKEYKLVEAKDFAIVNNAIGRIAEAVSYASGIPQFDDEHPEGWTETQLVALGTYFWQWREELTKKKEMRRNSLVATDSPLDTNSTTNLGTDCIATENESTCNGPTVSP